LWILLELRANCHCFNEVQTIPSFLKLPVVKKQSKTNFFRIASKKFIAARKFKIEQVNEAFLRKPQHENEQTNNFQKTDAFRHNLYLLFKNMI